MQRLHIEESQRRNVVFHRSGAEFSLLEQIALVAANMIRTELVRRLAEVLREPLHEAHIVADRTCRIVAPLELFEQHFAKMGHSALPPVTHTLSRLQSHSTGNTAATAAPAASFSPAIRKLGADQLLPVWRQT